MLSLLERSSKLGIVDEGGRPGAGGGCGLEARCTMAGA